MTREKSRYSDAELEEFRSLIMQKLDISRQNFNSFRQQLEESAVETKIKSLDDYNDSAEADQLANMLSREEKHIKHLENALARIQNKVYGICRETGKLIPKERLLAVPHATLCIEAKQGRA